MLTHSLNINSSSQYQQVLGRPMQVLPLCVSMLVDARVSTHTNKDTNCNQSMSPNPTQAN